MTPTLVMILLWLFILWGRPVEAQNDLTAGPLNSNPPKIHNVREVAALLQTNPEHFKNQTIWIQAYKVNVVRGLGCEDYAIFADAQDSALYQRQFEGGMTEEELQALAQIPTLKSGPTLRMEETIFPTTHGVYEGNFNDPILSQQCDDGSRRLVISRKIREVVDQSESFQKTVSKGTVIALGEVLPPPYTVFYLDGQISVNGRPYPPPKILEVNPDQFKEDPVEPLLNSAYIPFQTLVDQLESNQLVIIGQNYQLTKNDPSSGLVEEIVSIKNSSASSESKKSQLAQLLGIPIEDPVLEGLITDWGIPKP